MAYQLIKALEEYSFSMPESINPQETYIACWEPKKQFFWNSGRGPVPYWYSVTELRE